MHSSILHSEAHDDEVRGLCEGALPPGSRQTAANRPGQAQPVPTRDVPALPWVRIGTAVFIILVVLLAAWEWQMRRLELRAGDLSDSPQAWAEQRRAANLAPVTIIGDSRILFDTDLDRFEALTGLRPIQASMVGTTARAILENFANDPKFHGLLIVGLAETSYYRPSGIGIGKPYIEGFEANGKPSQLSGLWIDRFLQRHIAFLDREYRLSRMIEKFDRGIRQGVDSPYDDVWKISETFDDRQYFMWDRIEHDKYLRMHARWAWGEFKGKPIPPPVITKVNRRGAEAASRIRARGGEVIFIRPPSSPELRVNEEMRVPKAKAWAGLLAAANAKGIHADELSQAQDLVLPEWSHLNRKCATVFTDAYVRRLTELTPRLRLRAGAPPPLTRSDCVPAVTWYRPSR